MKSFKIIITVLLINLSISRAYKILAIFPFHAKSHDNMLSAFAKGLAERKHQVDVVTHYPAKNPPETYRIVVNLSGTEPPIINSFHIDYAKTIAQDVTVKVADRYGSDLCHYMNLPDFQKLTKKIKSSKDKLYDLVVLEAFGSSCFMGFGHLLKVPVIGISTLVEFPWISDFIGNDDNLAYVPSCSTKYFDKTKFWDRLMNLLHYHYEKFRFHSKTEKIQTELMRKYLSPDMPNVREIEKQIALTFVNRHPVIFGIKPLVPSLVELSALHMEEDPKLPDLQKWLDESNSGVVYFTFGSMVLIETLPKHQIFEIYNSLRKLNQRVLLKIADPTKLPPNLPENVLTSPWIPQQAVLKHKNVKLFITHGGLMGSQEALYYGVPMIGIPLFGDQPINVDKFVQMKMSLKIDFDNLTTNSLDWALNEIFTNYKVYKERAEYNSRLFKDRPMSPMDTAEYWIKYVIRYGAGPLKSPALELNWWQLSMLDVYIFLLIFFSVIVFFLCILIQLFFNLIKNRISIKHVSKTLSENSSKKVKYN
ncbi:UDP-glucuronosyltransferase 2C1-like isoform X2 [Trichogramma pretiosum]|uniref:UDP-glucuronosyltransferase 2C1-like isoform X2 n=1 Tax=Trichogramma pretiosum TaxID=7493 RepID=UPI000C71C267|nr:UDP-glucuronosyltransferase 2C1-like isoform X2 [Trichogramma pretiosum]